MTKALNRREDRFTDAEDVALPASASRRVLRGRKNTAIQALDRLDPVFPVSPRAAPKCCP